MKNEGLLKKLEQFGLLIREMLNLKEKEYIDASEPMLKTDKFIDNLNDFEKRLFTIIGRIRDKTKKLIEKNQAIPETDFENTLQLLSEVAKEMDKQYIVYELMNRLLIDSVNSRIKLNNVVVIKKGFSIVELEKSSKCDDCGNTIDCKIKNTNPSLMGFGGPIGQA